MTVKEYLERVAAYMKEQKGVPYTVESFKYPVVSYGYGTHSDDPVEVYAPELKTVIGVAREGVEPREFPQSLICWPNEHPEFFAKGDFIMYSTPHFPSEENDTLESEVDLDRTIYGLSKETAMTLAMKK